MSSLCFSPWFLGSEMCQCLYCPQPPPNPSVRGVALVLLEVVMKLCYWLLKEKTLGAKNKNKKLMRCLRCLRRFLMAEHS